MDSYSSHPEPFRTIEGGLSGHWLVPHRQGQLLLVKTADRAREAITELIAQWILRSPFYLIAAGEWLPDHDELRYSLYRHTAAFDSVLDTLILSRPFTCLQLLDLLMEAEGQHKPVLILDFLHLFYDADVDLSLRYFTLEKCCQYTKRLSFSSPVAMIVPNLEIEDYRRFFPFVASIADEIMETAESPSLVASQGRLF